MKIKTIKTKVSDFFKKLGGAILVIVFLGILVIFGLQTQEILPDFTFVFVDTNTMHYFAPDCLINIKSYTQMTAGQARFLNFTPDPECRDRGYFMGTSRNFIGQYLADRGLLWQTKSRWNLDGSWNW